MKKLTDLWTECGVDLEISQIADSLDRLLEDFHPDWTDEDLLFCPDESMTFANIVREYFSSTDLPDELILRSLVRARKTKLISRRSQKRLHNRPPLQNIFKEHGVNLNRAEINQILFEVKQDTYPNLTDEELSFRPDQAKRYCCSVRVALKNKDVPDDLIMRALFQIRKAFRCFASS